MSTLKPETITRKKAVTGFTGVGTLMQNGDDQFWIVAANGEVLATQLAELMPHAEADGETFKNVTIIEAQ